MKNRAVIGICLVAAGLLVWIVLRSVPIGAFGVPCFISSVDEGHSIPGMSWQIVYNDAGAAHSGNFWTWVIEDRGIFRIVVAQGYSTADVRYGDTPFPVKMGDGSACLGFARSRYGNEIEWRKVDAHESIAGVPWVEG